MRESSFIRNTANLGFRKQWPWFILMESLKWFLVKFVVNVEWISFALIQGWRNSLQCSKLEVTIKARRHVISRSLAIVVGNKWEL